jgi:hypothetical protein
MAQSRLRIKADDTVDEPSCSRTKEYREEDPPAGDKLA